MITWIIWNTLLVVVLYYIVGFLTTIGPGAVFRHTNLKQTLARKFEKWMEGIAVSLRPAGYWTGDEYFYTLTRNPRHQYRQQQIIMLEEGMLEGMSWVVREIKFLREEMKEVQGAVNRLTLGLQEEREKQESAEQDSIVVLELLRKKIDASEMKILSLEKDEKERGDDYLELLKGEIKTRTWHDSQQASKVEDLERRVGESISELESIISDLQNRPPDRSTTDTDMALSPLSPPSYSSQAPGTPSTAIKLTDNQHIFDKISANTECIEELQHEFSLLGKLFENTRQSASTEMTKLDLQLKQYVDQKLTQS